MVTGLPMIEDKTVKVDKIVLSASQTELLRKTLDTALEEAPAPVKDLIRNIQPPKMEEKKQRTEKRTEEDSGLVF